MLLRPRTQSKRAHTQDAKKKKIGTIYSLDHFCYTAGFMLVAVQP